MRFGAVLVGVLGFWATAALADTGAGPIEFQITRGGKAIGSHKITFAQDGPETIVDVAIEIDVRMMVFPVFSYRHRNREVWRDGVLVALDTETNDNGDELFVRARATVDGLEVENRDGVFVAPAEVLPTSYWHPETARQRQLLDTQNGELVDLVVRPLGSDPVLVGDQAVAARKYDVSGDLDLVVWYTPEGDWAKLMFAARGADIEYVPVGEWAARLEGDG